MHLSSETDAVAELLRVDAQQAVPAGGWQPFEQGLVGAVGQSAAVERRSAQRPAYLVWIAATAATVLLAVAGWASFFHAQGRLAELLLKLSTSEEAADADDVESLPDLGEELDSRLQEALDGLDLE